MYCLCYAVLCCYVSCLQAEQDVKPVLIISGALQSLKNMLTENISLQQYADLPVY